MSLLVKAENGWHTCHTSPRNRKLRREGIANATVHYLSNPDSIALRLAREVSPIDTETFWVTLGSAADARYLAAQLIELADELDLRGVTI
jgi:hypothetical protein